MDLSRNADEIVEWFSLAAFGKTAEVFLKPRMKGAGRLELCPRREGLFPFRVLYSPHTRQERYRRFTLIIQSVISFHVSFVPQGFTYQVST